MRALFDLSYTEVTLESEVRKRAKLGEAGIKRSQE